MRGHVEDLANAHKEIYHQPSEQTSCPADDDRVQKSNLCLKKSVPHVGTELGAGRFITHDSSLDEGSTDSCRHHLPHSASSASIEKDLKMSSQCTLHVMGQTG